jgi:hypothetical protein
MYSWAMRSDLQNGKVLELSALAVSEAGQLYALALSCWLINSTWTFHSSNRESGCTLGPIFDRKKEIPVKSTKDQRKQGKNATGTNISELKIDTGALNQFFARIEPESGK